MQGAKFTFHIPPAMREIRKFSKFSGIKVIGDWHYLIIDQAKKNRAVARVSENP